MPKIFYLNSSDGSIFNILGYLVSFHYNHVCIEIPEINANSVDPDQTPHSAMSGLGLHCLSMSLLQDATRKWVDRFENVITTAADNILKYVFLFILLRK